MSGTGWLDEPFEEGISEAASEKQVERRRGRPRVTSPDFDNTALPFYRHKTRRTYRKRFHAERAIAVLLKTERPDFSYLLGETFTRWEILTELGQLEDEGCIHETAVTICNLRLKTKEAVALIRRWRSGKSAPGDTAALGNEIIRVIRIYKLRHRDMTSEQVQAALWHAEQEFGGSGEEQREEDGSRDENDLRNSEIAE